VKLHFLFGYSFLVGICELLSAIIILGKYEPSRRMLTGFCRYILNIYNLFFLTGHYMDFLDFLFGVTSNPIIYSLIFFIYVILAVIVLPIPVEIGLFNPSVHPVILIALLAMGKGAGSLIVYFIGATVRKGIKARTIGKNFIFTKKLIGLCEGFVKKYGYYGLFIIMSTPLMIDSVSLYLFSILNPQNEDRKALSATRFVLVNIFAGAIRGIIILTLAYYVGIKLV
jgi:membrane protein YqaA with SNARE-associated domain